MTEVAEKKSPMRIYAVRHPDHMDARLVRASTPAQALKHVTRPFEVELADQEALVKLIGEGVRVETAGTDEESGS